MTTITRDVFTVYQSMFLDDLEAANKSPKTLEAYGIAVKQLGEFLRSTGMPLDPTELTGEHMREFMRYLAKPIDAGGKGLGDSTRNQRFRALALFFKYLKNNDEIRESPMKNLPRPAVPQTAVPVIKMGDLDKLLRSLTGSDYDSRMDKAMVSLFIDCGFRISEMAGMRMSQLDVEEREVTVLGKGRKVRTVKFTTETRKDLNRFLLKRAAHSQADSDFVWLGTRGPLQRSGMYRRIVNRCKAVGLSEVHPHMFRHTMAHEYLHNGGNEGDLMKVTGWNTRAMVDRYGASAATQRAKDAHDTFSPRKKLRY
jgi:site-specific recombinase XerC